MQLRLRIDIVEGQGVIVFIDLRAWQLAAQDAREDVARIVRLGRVYGHSRLPDFR
jgi:hypothetical protein